MTPGRQHQRAKTWISLRSIQATSLRLDANSVYAGLDYVLASAVKPLRVVAGRGEIGDAGK
jgi:hypothetical protein